MRAVWTLCDAISKQDMGRNAYYRPWTKRIAERHGSQHHKQTDKAVKQIWYDNPLEPIDEAL